MFKGLSSAVITFENKAEINPHADLPPNKRRIIETKDINI
jgi:hypothetical protein